MAIIQALSAETQQPQQSGEDLRPSAREIAVDMASSADDTVTWLQESLQAAGPACAAAGASILLPQAPSTRRERQRDDRRRSDPNDSWRAAAGGTMLPGINSGKATAHAMLLRCLVLYRRQPTGGRESGTATAAPPPPKVVRNLPALLQDMALCVAEAVSAVYMADVRNGSLGTAAVWNLEGQATGDAIGQGTGRGGAGGPAVADRGEGRGFEEVSVPALLDPRLATTRELERFRNHVAMAAAVRRSYGRVRDVYEDRCDAAPCSCTVLRRDVALPGPQALLPHRRFWLVHGMRKERHACRSSAFCLWPLPLCSALRSA